MTNKTNSIKTFLPYLPLYLAVPVGYALLFTSLGHPIHWGAFGIGALGWLIALILRSPVAIIAGKLANRSSAQLIIVSSSGPLEEIVRLVVLALTSFTLSHVLSVGQGWAAIEVVYAIINGIMMIVLANGTDEKSAEARKMMEQQGMRTDLSPLVGVIERVTASAFHIGATLLIAFEPWLVLLLIPAHSLLNLGASRLMKSSIVWAEVLVGIFGIAALAAGWLLHI
jgi:hypothetical protein